MATTPLGSASNLQSLSNLLKQHYEDPSVIQDTQIDYGPCTAKLLDEANTAATGINTPFPVIVSGGGGVSSLMSSAYASATPAASQNFLLTRATAFGSILLGGEVMAASEDPSGAFFDDLSLEISVKFKRLREYLASMIFGDGTGAQAQILSISGAVIQLADAPTAARFQQNDAIQVGVSSNAANTASISGSWVTYGSLTASSTLPTSAPSTPQVGYVQSVNIPAGQITVGSVQGGGAVNVTTIWAGSGLNVPAAGSFIFMAGDSQGAIAPTSTTLTNVGVPVNPGGAAGSSSIPTGLLAWMPLGGPPSSGDSFFGVNRYGASQLYGQVIDATANGSNLGTIRAALTNAVAQLRQVGSKPEIVYVHPLAFYKLSLELQSQGMYPGSSGQGPEGEGSLGFSTLMLPTDAGDIEVVGDPQCVPCLTNPTFAPANGYSGAMTAFVLDSNWEVISIGEVPKLEERDGNYFLRITGQDNFQMNYRSYFNLGSHRPNGSACVLLPL